MVGVVEGRDVVGVVEGPKDGAMDGLVDGVREGALLGLVEGETDGEVDGDKVGKWVGALDGLDVAGACEGTRLGAFVTRGVPPRQTQTTWNSFKHERIPRPPSSLAGSRVQPTLHELTSAQFPHVSAPAPTQYVEFTTRAV